MAFDRFQLGSQCRTLTGGPPRRHAGGPLPSRAHPVSSNSDSCQCGVKCGFDPSSSPLTRLLYFRLASSLMDSYKNLLIYLSFSSSPFKVEPHCFPSGLFSTWKKSCPQPGHRAPRSLCANTEPGFSLTVAWIWVLPELSCVSHTLIFHLHIIMGLYGCLSH